MGKSIIIKNGSGSRPVVDHSQHHSTVRAQIPAIAAGTRGQCYKTFLSNKLECLSLASLSSLLSCLRVRLEPTQVRHISGTPLHGRLLASPSESDLVVNLQIFFIACHQVIQSICPWNEYLACGGEGYETIRRVEHNR